jgi:rRNA maturation endonuclease Nob1
MYDTNNALDINLSVNSKMHCPEYKYGISMIQCRRCKKKIRGEIFYVGSPPLPYCKNCAGKVTP